MNLTKFQDELKYRLKIKANKRNGASKIFLDCFKYYDY